jgi:bifunctional DNA-binding transcriptional regulator/antitoxin component of YhaV-PrlF toxin-antitoxin module
MRKSSEYTVEVDEQGRLILPESVRKRYGITPGAKIRLDQIEMASIFRALLKTWRGFM